MDAENQVATVLQDILSSDDLVLDFAAAPSHVKAGSYDVAYAFDVLNFQPHTAGITHVLTSLRAAVHSSGVIVFNFPKSPRAFSGLDDGDLIALCGRLGMIAQCVPGHAGVFMAMINS
jgi:hypothetical protein